MNPLVVSLAAFGVASADDQCDGQADYTTCDDGDPLTGLSWCESEECVGMDLCSGVTCTAPTQCHEQGQCDKATGLCSDPRPEASRFLKDLTPCDDGDPSTPYDVCLGGFCVGFVNEATLYPSSAPTSPPTRNPTGTPTTAPPTTAPTDPCSGVVCTAKSQCHEAGECNPQTGICSEPTLPDYITSCDDGDPMTAVSYCVAGACEGLNLCNSDEGEPITCTAPSQCHEAGTCDPSNGLCTIILKPDGSTCDDGNDETYDDVCIEGAGCVGKTQPPTPAPSQTPTEAPIGLCTGVVCAAITQCHAIGKCDPETGVCSTPTLPDYITQCDDGNPATVADTCQSGVCIGMDLCEDVICVPQSQCHEAGQCNPENGLCSEPLPENGDGNNAASLFKPDMTPCDDGDSNTPVDYCISGVCVGQVNTAEPTNGPTADPTSPPTSDRLGAGLETEDDGTNSIMIGAIAGGAAVALLGAMAAYCCFREKPMPKENSKLKWTRSMSGETHFQQEIRKADEARRATSGEYSPSVKAVTEPTPEIADTRPEGQPDLDALAEAIPHDLETGRMNTLRLVEDQLASGFENHIDDDIVKPTPSGNFPTPGPS